MYSLQELHQVEGHDQTGKHDGYHAQQLDADVDGGTGVSLKGSPTISPPTTTASVDIIKPGKGKRRSPQIHRLSSFE